MKILNLILIGAIIGFVPGCTTVFKPWTLKKLQQGMKKEQVFKVLGNPDYTTRKDGFEYLYYTYREEPTPVIDTPLESPKGIDQWAKGIVRKLKEHKYEVALVDGRLTQYREVRD